MISTFNLASVYVANVIGAFLLIILMATNVWRLRERSEENRCLMVMMVLAFTNCLIDPISYSLDGHPGALNRFLVTFGNAWLYIALMMAAEFWVHFVEVHLNGSISKRHLWTLKAFVIVGAALMVVNFFVPIVFEVDANNVYHRKNLFFYYVAVDYLFMMDSLVSYLHSKYRGGSLKFFPIWVYILPVFAGGVAQTLFYGVSVSYVSLAVAVAGVLASLQNERIFRDSLTGLYNRAYLDYLLKKYSRRKKNLVSGIMLDLNDFKRINDEFGHAVGDEALINAASILKKVVGELGLVIRYAGDEFIIFVNSQDDAVIEDVMNRARAALRKFNEVSGAVYVLSAAMGSCKLDFSEMRVDAFINEIDRRMYEEKRDYYAENISMDRRKR